MKLFFTALVFSAGLAGCATTPEPATEAVPEAEIYTLPDEVIS